MSVTSYFTTMHDPHAIVAGATFDVSGYLAIALKWDKETQRQVAAHLLTWAKARGLQLQNADVLHWTDGL